MFVQADNKVGDEAWRVREAIRNVPETYDRAQQGIPNGAAALIQGSSPKEVVHQRKMQALFGDRFIQ